MRLRSSTRRALVLIAIVSSVLVVAGVAMADDPDGNLQQAVDLIEAEIAKSPVVTTVTETVTATVTETVTAPPPTTPPPTTPPPSACTGTQVSPGGGLKAAMDGAPAGTTFCLGAGTFTVGQTVALQAGDTVIGAGRDATFVDGSGISISASGIFEMGGVNGTQTFSDLEVFGAPTPAAGVTGVCNPNSNCGKAFSVGNVGTLRLFGVDCHDNGGNCVGGGGAASVVVDDLECWANGNNYSMTSSFRYAGCIKRAAVYTGGGAGNTTVTNSYFHDNIWDGVWCDFCKVGLFDIRDNLFEDNGGEGIQWEMSGGWSALDSAVITGNTFHGNNHLNQQTFRGGMHVSTANDVLIENNIFGDNFGPGIGIIYTTGRGAPQPDSRGVIARNNTMNGDTVNGCTLAGVTCSGNSA